MLLETENQGALGHGGSKGVPPLALYSMRTLRIFDLTLIASETLLKTRPDFLLRGYAHNLTLFHQIIINHYVLICFALFCIVFRFCYIFAIA